MKKLVPFILILVLLAALSGCGNNTGSTTLASNVDTGNSTITLSGPCTISVIVGGTANSATILSPTAESILYQAVRYPGSRIIILMADGNPHVVDSLTVNKLSDSANDAALEKAYQSSYSAVCSVIYNAVAESPEVDIMRAINFAADADSEYIIVARNGCSTSGIMDLRSGVPQDPSDYVSQLNSRSAIPNMSGAKVVMTSITKGYGSQPELSYSQNEHLRQLYEELFTCSGAEILAMENNIMPTTSAQNLPTCTPIAVVQDHFNYSELTAGGIELNETNSGVYFKGDSTDFVDVQKAHSDLNDIYNNLDKSLTYKIIGSTATGREDYCRDLSLRRAEACKAYLVSLGFPSDHLITEGEGCTGSDHINDVNQNGDLIEDLAKQNRKIRIVKA